MNLALENKMKLLFADRKFHNVIISVSWLLLMHVTCCHGNSVPYQHLPGSVGDIQVDQVVSLGSAHTVAKATDSNLDNQVRHVSNDHNGKVKVKDNQVAMETREKDGNGRGRDRNGGTEWKKERISTKRLLAKIEMLQNELMEVKLSQVQDRENQKRLEERLSLYHDETMVSIADVVQVRQIVTETYDKAQLLNDVVQDHSVLLEGYQYFRKETEKESRRYHEYKERTAKRFHQIENSMERLDKSVTKCNDNVKKLTLEVQETLDNRVASLRDTIDIVDREIHNKLKNISNTTSQCCANTHQLIQNLTTSHKTLHSAILNSNQGRMQYLTNQKAVFKKPTNERPVFQKQTNNRPVIKKTTNEIKIVEFGSGYVEEENVSNLEELSNTYGLSTGAEKVLSEVEQGSGEMIESYESSGDTGNGHVEEETITYVDLSNYIPVSVFHSELEKRDNLISSIGEKFSNVTMQVEILESRVTSIQLGNFMQSLQDSLINFTQNVITMDQWKLSSSQIVNSTLNNQDQIIKLTNMILENSGKMAEIRSNLANTELMNDQQFSLVRMYIIRLNNSLEDLKEEMRKINQHIPPKSYNTQYSGYNGYNPNVNSEYDEYDDYNNEADPSSNLVLKTLMSRIDNIGIQIVYNQNRIGQLEVKVLNESLVKCQKFNMDMYQDSKLAEHDVLIQGNLEAISLTHKMVNEIDGVIRRLDGNLRAYHRKAGQNEANIETLRRIIPIMVTMREEMENLKFQLPKDCSEYYAIGHRESGIYIIHPEGVAHSVRIMCHMSQNVGWTIIQQRFDGSENFDRNWTDYKLGFGKVSGEYWSGNELIHLLTSQKNMSVLIEMVDIDNITWIAEYDHFHVGSSNDKYVLTVKGYHGNATDGLSYASDMGFSTTDRDNDATSTHCAYYYESGWWFKHCQIVNLNGRYKIGFVWFNMDTNTWVRLKTSTMKLMPRK